MSKVKVLFFATLRQAAGVKALELEIPERLNVQGLLEMLGRDYPALQCSPEDRAGSHQPRVRICGRDDSRRQRSGTLSACERRLNSPGSALARRPDSSENATNMPLPTIISITSEEIDLNALLRQVTLPTTGAAAIFTGIVRQVTERAPAHETGFLEYEAYEAMAEAKMHQVADEIRGRWPIVQGIAIVQRVGKLMPQTPTVLIACTAAHRDDGVFDAARYGIDRLKEIVPVWKKEAGPSGEWWVEGDYVPKPGE